MTTSPQQQVPAIPADQALEMIDGGAVLIAIRELNEWQAGHAPMAVHIPMSALGSGLSQLDKNAPTIFICRSGRRSDSAVAALVGAGYNAINLLGGMQAWQQAGGSVVRDDSTPGMVI